MEKKLYEIRDLQCAYQPGQVVLDIPSLDIEREQLVFVVGVSGGGKSTLLETLGLMNHTTAHAPDKGSVRFFPAREAALPLLDLWAAGDAARSAFRRHYLSFIFQHTNLMPNFSAGENMMAAALLAGLSVAEAAEKVQALMEQIGLPAAVFSRSVRELSGGQRQRLAFIRALIADYELLFGDEPTGNLDARTADVCMQLLRSHLQASRKTAIIVTHDLRMACRYADTIIPIGLHYAADGQPYGRVNGGRVLRMQTDGSALLPSGLRIEEPVGHLYHTITAAE